MHKSLLAFLVGFLLFLAGIIDLMSGVLDHVARSRWRVDAAPLWMGVLFVSGGALWLGVGVTLKRRAAREDEPRR